MCPVKRLINQCLVLVIAISSAAFSQPNVYEAKSILYNSMGAAVLGGFGAVINKNEHEKVLKVFLRGFAGGAGGGLLVYAGKRSSQLIVVNHNIAYGWISRLVFSAGNSIVENAASNKALLNSFHLDLACLRLDIGTCDPVIRPSLMPFALISTLYNISVGQVDLRSSLAGGTLVIRTKKIPYANYLTASTNGNNFLLRDSVTGGQLFLELYAHEMVHTFQFMEYSPVNNYFLRIRKNHVASRPVLAKIDRWIHGDVNYLLMLGNYFGVNGGYRRSLYCRNFLENEAEVLSTGRVSCPAEH